MQYKGVSGGVKHSFSVEVAAAVGVHAAIVFDNLAYWIKRNTLTGRNERRGVYWTYGTHKDLAAQFDYLSEKQVRTALNKLIVNEYIQAGRFNKHKYDRTNWYTLTEKGERAINNRLNQKPKEAKAHAAGGDPIPNNKTDKKPNDNILARASALRARLAESGET